MEKILNLLPMTPEQLAAFHEKAKGNEIVLAPRPVGAGRVEPLTQEQYAGATVILGNAPARDVAGIATLKWLHAWSAGTDHYTAPGILRAGCMLTSSTGAYGQGVAEHMLAVLLSLFKHLPEYRDLQRAQRWDDLGPVRSLQGAAVLVAGVGDLGSSFARLCGALGAHTLGVRRDAGTPVDGIDEMFAMETFDSLLPRADVVALFLPHTQETAGLMDERRLLLMREDAVLLNAGRGTAVDLDALVRVLQTGRLWGAGLDVTEQEPLPAGHPLWRQERLVLTPHVAGGNRLPSTQKRVIEIALENLRRYLAGEALQNRVR